MDSVRLSNRVGCAAPGCRVTGRKRVRAADGLPVPPAGWYEVLLNGTVLFAHSKACAQAITAGHVTYDATVVGGGRPIERG